MGVVTGRKSRIHGAFHTTQLDLHHSVKASAVNDKDIVAIEMGGDNDDHNNDEEDSGDGVGI